MCPECGDTIPDQGWCQWCNGNGGAHDAAFAVAVADPFAGMARDVMRRAPRGAHLTLSQTGETVWEKVWNIAQGTSWDDVQIGVRDADGFVCVANTPPSDCMGGVIVWQKSL